MIKWPALFALAALLGGCSGAGEPLNIRRDAFAGYLSRAGVGTDAVVNETLPAVRTGRKGGVSARDELGNRCYVRVYVDKKHPMLLHVIKTSERPCADCGGSGIRGNLGGIVNLKCYTCDGSGKGGSTVSKKRYRVSPADLATGAPDTR